MLESVRDKRNPLYCWSESKSFLVRITAIMDRSLDAFKKLKCGATV